MAQQCCAATKHMRHAVTRFENMRKIKTGVVGVGYLGKYHAEKYASLPQSEFVAICDVHADRRREITEQYHVPEYSDYRDLIGKVDAVSIAAPTPMHHAIGCFFLQHGVHVLIEKPIATTLEEADELIKLAKKNYAILQVGHLERFNNVVKAVEPVLSTPRFIESLRLAPFKLRGSDVNVILDLMIHDIDIIQSIVKSEISDIRANGASVLSPSIDIANARIEFENGCVANVTASRVSLKTERKLRIFQHDSYIGLDLDHKILTVHRKGTREMFPGIPEISRERIRIDKGDALRNEIDSFLNSIIHNDPVVVSGEEAKRALATAIQITHVVGQTNELFPISFEDTCDL